MAEYHIEFDTREMAPHIVSIRVRLDRHVTRDMGAAFSINLSDDPLYPALERYVLANPSRARLKGKS